MKFDNITIVNVDGRTGDYSGAILSLIISQRSLPGSKALLLSPERPTNLPTSIEHIKIAPMGYIDYSLFITFLLGDFITTDWALVVQDDGWVLDGSKWRNEFFNYDYIGAPTHFAEVVLPDKGIIYFRHFEWINYIESATRITYVMNGGFSLRSRRFLNSPKSLKLNYSIQNLSTDNRDECFYIKAFDESILEDVQLCIHMRKDLEDSGITFAPLSLSRLFSIEHYSPSIHHNVNIDEIFGHHSKFRKIESIEPMCMRVKLFENQIDQIVGENKIISKFMKLGYSIKYLPD